MLQSLKFSFESKLLSIRYELSKFHIKILSGSEHYSTFLFITQDFRMISISVIALWKANNKVYTPSEFHFAPTRIVTLGEVRNLCSSLWVTADHSSLKCSQNTHKSFKSSEINAKRSVTSSCLTPPIFVFKFFSHNTQSPIQASALFTPAHHTN